MGRSPAKAKARAKRPAAAKARKDKRLAEALKREAEAQEQQTATAEILGIISRSPADAQPVFDAIAVNALRLCGAAGVAVARYDGALLHLAASHNVQPDAVDRLKQQFPLVPDRRLPLGRAVLDAAVIQVPDLQARTDFSESVARQFGARSHVSIPLLHQGRALGAIGISRRTLHPFSHREIALLQTFANQAVIAIENVRLFKELAARNSELTESLEQQTATSEILGVISSSPTDIGPVFEAIVRRAVTLCEGLRGIAVRLEAGRVHLAAHFNLPLRAAELLEESYPRAPTRDYPAGRAIVDRARVHVFAEDGIAREFPAMVARVAVGSLLAVPLLREGQPIGAINITRTQAVAFTERQIALLQTFADQAVIAIENVRLFKELQARTGELTRSVEQLTALGEVGQAVSSSLDLETVLTTIVSRAVQLSGLDGGVVFEYDEAAEKFVQRAAIGTANRATAAREVGVRKGEGVVGRTALTLQPVQIPDISVAGAYEGRIREDLIAAGVRALVAVPILREGRLIGGLAVNRNQPGEFQPEMIELLKTFATQSALAIQNARLFLEIEDKSRQLEVVSQHKSEFLANMSHELRTPLNAIIGFSEVLSERMFGELNEKQDEYLKDIHASGTHLLSLINDILDLSKIEAGRMELELTDFDLPTAIENALMLVRERAGRRSLTLHKSVDAGVGQLRADERKIRQVVLNLLSNAIKFTPEGGRIEVAAAPRNGFIEVSVSDTGVGIAPEDQERVFEEFRQVGTAEKKAEGTGLGLTLCRKFVELHGGRIWVKSQVGQGTVFTFTVPAIE